MQAEKEVQNQVTWVVDHEVKGIITCADDIVKKTLTAEQQLVQDIIAKAGSKALEDIIDGMCNVNSLSLIVSCKPLNSLSIIYQVNFLLHILVLSLFCLSQVLKCIVSTLQVLQFSSTRVIWYATLLFSFVSLSSVCYFVPDHQSCLVYHHI